MIDGTDTEDNDNEDFGVDNDVLNCGLLSLTIFSWTQCYAKRIIHIPIITTKQMLQ